MSNIAESDKQKKPVCQLNSERTGSFSDRKTLVVGLTGGVATGKTTIAEMFESLGARIISADDIVHRILEPNTNIWKKIVENFGDEILNIDGTINRSKLAKIVFGDIEKRKLLESIIHPFVMRHIREEIEKFRKNEEGALILEIPLLIETGSQAMVEKVLIVFAEQETQIERLKKRYSISREEAMERISSQLPMAEKLKFADWVINTEGTIHSAKKQVEKVWDDIQKSLAQL